MNRAPAIRDINKMGRGGKDTVLLKEKTTLQAQDSMFRRDLKGIELYPEE